MASKRIILKKDLEIWLDSDTHANLLLFVADLQGSVVGLANDADVAPSPFASELDNTLGRLEHIIEEHPVVKDKEISRFGKPEFREFYDALTAEAPSMLKKLIPQSDKAASHLDEVLSYFTESWGNRTRIDYGSGHELNFVCFLFCARQLGAYSEQEYAAVVLKGFTRYMSVMRVLQKTYWLEPAGSHGVWGLDDYHFLPFLFGAAQLATHPHMKPKLIHNKELVETMWPKYMYLECIHFINQIKTVPGKLEVSLRWHSPMLDDILSAKSWRKIKEGMVKMYLAEVLSKLPIVQHLRFGELLPAPDGLGTSDPSEDSECGHVHANTWGDCCGIKVPSAIAASQAQKERPVPFD